MRIVNTVSPVKRHFIFITCFLSGCRVLTDWNITRSPLITLLCAERARSRRPVWGCGCLMLNIGWVRGRLLWLSVCRSAWMTGESSAVWLADRRSNRLLYWLTARNHTDPHDRKHWVWNIRIVWCWFISWWIAQTDGSRSEFQGPGHQVLMLMIMPILFISFVNYALTV